MPGWIFKVVKKQKSFTEPHAKSLEPDLGSKTTTGFKTWFLCKNSFGILILNYYHKDLHLRCSGGPNDSLEISCWKYCVLINNHNQELIGVMENQKNWQSSFLKAFSFSKKPWQHSCFSLLLCSIIIINVSHNVKCFRRQYVEDF